MGGESTLKERAHQNESISGILHPVEDEDKEFKECEEKKRQQEMKTDAAELNTCREASAAHQPEEHPVASLALFTPFLWVTMLPRPPAGFSSAPLGHKLCQSN